MTRYCLSPDCLFDRPWRPGHPFRPRTCRARRLGMAALLAVLCLVIGGYAWLTDSDRVRSMAESYLSSLVGGRVKVGGANLSIFEGLRLDDVKVFVEDDPGPAGAGARPSTAPAAPAPDSLVFSARSFVISYDPRTMLRGELRATRIVAENPRVQLTQDVRGGTWNYARLGRERRDRPTVHSTRPFRPTRLPGLLLRNARVEVAELREGKKNVLGYVAIDGRLTPADAGPDAPDARRVDFVLQTRGVTDAMGPLASGSVDLATGRVTARLGEFEFGHDIRSLLLTKPRQWTDRHGLAGRVDIPWLEYTPAREGGEARPRFLIRMGLRHVALSIPAEEWSGARRGAPRAAPPEPSPAGAPARASELAPIRLRDLAGAFEFTQDGIAIRDVRGRLEDNGFEVDGHIDGYDPDAAVALRVSSPRGESDESALRRWAAAALTLKLAPPEPEPLNLPESPRYIGSLPPDLREVYDLLRPRGRCRLQVDVARPAGSAVVRLDGHVELVDGDFVFKDFPYPLREVTGRVSFGRDPADGLDWVRLENVRGRGVPYGCNCDAFLTVNGRVGPVGPGLPAPGLDLTVRADDIHSEEAISRAYPPEVRQALSLFDAPGNGQFPVFHGAFRTHVSRPPGRHQKVTVETDIQLKEADAALVGFPYPVRRATADVRVRDGYVDVVGAEIRRGDMSVKVAGRVTWAAGAPAADPATAAATTAPAPTAPASAPPAPTVPAPTALRVTVRNLPVDEALLAALPADCATWIRRMGATALLDVDGTLRASERHPAPGASPGPLPPATGPAVPPLDYDFDITLHDGSIRPGGGAFVVSDVVGRIHLTRERLELIELHGRRGSATLYARGGVTWPGDVPRLTFTASARDLSLEPALYALLPEGARKAWDELQPKGTLDAEVEYAPAGAGAGRPGKTVRIDLTRPEAAAVADAPGPALPPGFHAVLHPRDLSATMRTIPYALQHVTGTIDVRPESVTLAGVAARHGRSAFTLSGAGTIEPAPAWDLKVTGRDVEADADLRRALPPSLAGLCDSLKLAGRLGFDLEHLAWRPGPATPAAPGGGAAAPDSAPEIDLRGAVTFDGAAVDVGVPLTGIAGSLGFEAAVRRGRLLSLAGDLDLASLRTADREVTDLRATVLKPADQPELQISRLRGRVAGGDLAGQVSVAFPDDGPGRYGLSLVVRNADVKELAAEKDKELSGRLTASLALEGSCDRPEARRGRGDVVVSGREMYRIPLVLGMLQVTNLSLPVSSPFKSGVARYSVEGQKVTFEKIELRSDNMLMSGDGTLDFGTRRVRMNFVTDNPGGFRIPFVQDLWRGAQHELLRIQVRGTVQDPRVKASSMGTLWTTVDEVFKGDDAEDRGESRSRRH